MDTYEEVLLALADPTRRALYERLCERPRSVGELATLVPVSRPAVSQHLRVLADAGLVQSRREGTRNIYSPAPEGLAELRAYVESLWDEVLRRFAASARRDKPKGARR